MQIVIDIDKEDYEKIKKTSFVENTEIMFNQSLEDRKNTMMLFRVIDAIKNGTPLPKGHGRLIDADKIAEGFEWLEKVTNESSIVERAQHCKLMECIRIIDNAPTIIEADRDEEDIPIEYFENGGI